MSNCAMMQIVAVIVNAHVDNALRHHPKVM
jgi:hypothetical protein